MTTYLILRGKFEDDTINKLTRAVNTLSSEEKLAIILDSTGGDLHIAEEMEYIISSHSDKITLIASSNLYSAAFLLFFRCKCKRIVLPEALGLLHQPSRLVNHLENGRIMNFELVPYEESKKSYKKMLDFLIRLGLNKKELDKFKKGEDVYLSSQRLMELLINDLRNSQIDNQNDTKCC